MRHWSRKIRLGKARLKEQKTKTKTEKSKTQNGDLNISILLNQQTPDKNRQNIRLESSSHNSKIGWIEKQH